MSSALFGLLGVILGVIVMLIIHQQERRDKYLFAIVKERLSTAQMAYSWALKMKSVIHGELEAKSGILTESREWFNQSNLYLPPDIRRDFDRVISNVWDYKDNLLYYYQLKHDGEIEKAKIQHEDLMQYFGEIRDLPARIEASVSIYYDIEKKWSFRCRVKRSE